MPPIDRIYAGAAVVTVAQGVWTPTVPGPAQTFTVDDATGWPSSGTFPCKLNSGLSDEEHITCTRSGTTFTVVQRGYDGTSAQSHDNPTIEIYFDARSANLIVDHTDGNEADPHSTKLLNNARHDIEARHTFGAAYGTPATPAALTPGNAGNAGTGNNPAREDHVHNVPAGAAATITGVNAEGAAATFARSDHNHDIDTSPASALTLTSSNTEGVGLFARSDHGHSTAALPWGVVDYQILTTSNGPHSGTTTTDMALTGVPVDVARAYKVHVHTEWAVTGGVVWDVEFLVGGVLTNTVATINTAGAISDTISASFLWLPATGTPNLAIRATELSGTATLEFRGSATGTRDFWVEDIGPR